MARSRGLTNTMAYLALPVLVGPLLAYIVAAIVNLGTYVGNLATRGPNLANLLADKARIYASASNMSSLFVIGAMLGGIGLVLAVGYRLLNGRWPHELCGILRPCSVELRGFS